MESFKLLYQGTLADAPAELFLVGPGQQAIIRHMQAVNSDEFNRTMTIWVNGTAVENLFLPPSRLLAGGYASFNGSLALEAGDSMWAEADEADKVALSIYGMVIA
jgi:hypothetical protein